MRSTGTGTLLRGTSKASATKKRRDYEIDKLRKETQLLKEALNQKDRKIQQTNNALDEIKRLSTSELEEMRRALTKVQKSNQAYKRQLACFGTEQDRVKAASQQKVEKLQRERSELVRALHSISTHCTKALKQQQQQQQQQQSSSASTPTREWQKDVDGEREREEVFPKKVEPWLSLNYDPEAMPKKKSGRRFFVKPLPSGRVLVSELVSRIEQITKSHAEQSGTIEALKRSRSQVKQDLEERTREKEDMSEIVDLMVEEMRTRAKRSKQESQDQKAHGQVDHDKDKDHDFPSTSGYTESKKLRLIHSQMKSLHSQLEEVSERSKSFETQAVELEFYAKLHGKLVQQVYEHTLTSSGKIIMPKEMDTSI